MDWKSATTKDDGTVSIPERWLLLHYYEALNILFRMENALRVFVYVVLKNRFKEKWSDTAMQTVDEAQSTIATTAARRLAQAKGFGYLGYEITSPLMFLNSGELTNIICSDSHWSLFKPFFRGKKEIIKNKLDEIGTVRNALAHFRPLKNDDVELIKQNVKHAFVGIEQCLSEMMDTHHVVPTNTEYDWYKNLSTLGSNLCSVRLFQNSTERWVRCQIDVSSTVLRKYTSSEYRVYFVTRLISPAVITNFSIFARHFTFMTEDIPYLTAEKDAEPNIKKAVSFTFSRDALTENHAEIGNQIKDLLLKIETETELVKQDNLARGQLIDSVRISATLAKNERYWTFNTENLKSALGENDPPEYWGNEDLYASDFIAGSTKYPWMPSEISKEEEIPF